MPFIWNDKGYRVVDEDIDYDQTQFKVVRKIFITKYVERPSECGCKEYSDDSKCDVEFSEANIRRNFRKYGQIDSVEILKSQKSEAYITFAWNISALAAYLEGNREKRKTGFAILPANTWKQPNDDESNLTEVGDFPPIYMLNDDCLLTLFEYLDFDSLLNLSEVCQIFNDLLHERYFHKHKELNIDPDVIAATTIAKIRQRLRCIGGYVTKLKLGFSNYRYYSKNKFPLRLFQLIGKYIGQTIRHAEIYVDEVNKDMIAALEPMLRHLTTLTLIDDSSYVILNFEQLCPNLTKLKLGGGIVTFPLCNKQWPKLKYLKAREVANGFYRAVSFFKYNPQLTCLKICDSSSDTLFPAIVAHLSKLEKLTIWALNYWERCNILPTHIDQLSGLGHLTKLTLACLDITKINEILLSLPRLIKLKQLKLFAYDESEGLAPNQQYIVAIAQKLSNLEYLSFGGLTLEKTTALDVVRFANKLHSLHLHKCNIIMAPAFITTLVDVLKLNRSEGVGAALALYVDDEHDLETIIDENIQKYLNISKECSHSYYKYQ